MHVAVQEPLTCLPVCVNENRPQSRPQSGPGRQRAACRGLSTTIIQFVPVNTFTAVRAVCCIYLAGITLESVAV